MKQLVRRVLTHPIVTSAAFLFTHRVAPIFTLHRFRDDEMGSLGHDPNALRANLAWLRARRYRLLPLLELVDRLAAGEPLTRTATFTVDDGYADFASVAAPVFAEFDCPVTVFVTTGFLDGRQWMWWDKVSVALGALRREAEIRQTIESLKRIPESEKTQRIDQLVAQSGVQLPPQPTRQFAPLRWEDVRRLSRKGVTFGPHTVTHPVMCRVDDAQAQFEIVESWQRVRDEAGEGAVPVFCYPNGEEGDFDARERTLIASGGLRAALSTCPGYTSLRDFDPDRPSARFGLPRFSYADDRTSFIQIASGIERAKMAVRSAVAGGQR